MSFQSQQEHQIRLVVMAFINTFVPISSQPRPRPTVRCQHFDLPPPDRAAKDVLKSTLQSLMGSDSVPSPPPARLQKEIEEAADDSQAAFATVLASLGVTTGSRDDEGMVDVNMPTEPPFDALHACVLAGYAFRAYEDPQPGCYREVYETIVHTPSPDPTTEVIVTHLAYPNAEAVARTASGFFRLALTARDDDATRLFIVARINATVQLNALEERNFSLLNKPPTDDNSALSDELVLLAFESESAYNNGDPPLLRGSLQLAEIIAESGDSKSPTKAGPFDVDLKIFGEKVVKRNFFSASRLPEGLRLAFMGAERLAGNLVNIAKVEKARISVHITYVPFDMQSTDGGAVNESQIAANYLDVDAEVEESNIFGEGSSLREALKEKLPDGETSLPTNWKKLAKGVRKAVGDAQSSEEKTRATVREDIPQELFIKSFDTDTEVWLFHNADSKDLVVTFRGTEKVSWKNFVTDAQLFLQRWDAGGDIDLELSESTTVGHSRLKNVTGMIGGDVSGSLGGGSGMKYEGSQIADDASCVHYGFLRAYHAVRDAVLSAVDSVVGESLPEYRLYFVGHSLGGALATLCAADFAAFHTEYVNNIACLSYGSPKVGNTGFARRYNKLVKNSFRVVNDSDVVVRMPKSIGERNCERYHHVGRTVLINEDGAMWVEGEEVEEMRNRVLDPLRERYSDATKLLEHEREMWDQLVSGRLLQNHMVGCKRSVFYVRI